MNHTYSETDNNGKCFVMGVVMAHQYRKKPRPNLPTDEHRPHNRKLQSPITTADHKSLTISTPPQSLMANSVVVLCICFVLAVHEALAFSTLPLLPTNGRPFRADGGVSTSRLYVKEQLSIDDISEQVRQSGKEAQKRLEEATTSAEAEVLRREYMSKKGPFNQAMTYMRSLPNEDKPKLGAVVNEVKDLVEKAIADRKSELEIAEIEARMEDEWVDVTLPGVSRESDIGRRHPLSMTIEKAVDIFVELGYDTVTSCAESPEVESDYNCFEALNCPKDHPARDMQDTFYLSEDMETMLRTHTSAVQIRQLAKRKPPLRIVAPGRVFRRDDIDATHSLIFHQIEILALDKRGELNLGHLKGTVEHFLRRMFGPQIDIRFRASYFPFTEPSMEVDVFFRGKWLEVLGCGMVDPNVLIKAGLDPEEWVGFAAGFGVERFAMVIHQIPDIREFYNNDKRFLGQFPYHYDDGKSTAKGIL